MKKKLLTALSLAAVAIVSIVGTIAYLTSEDQDVNVMTMGKVSIEQLEYERVVGEDGKWISTGEVDQYGYTPDKMQEFTQGKPLLPKVGDTAWDDRKGSQAASGEGSHQQSWAQVGAPGSNQLFDDSVKNVQDKFVFVKNTGKTDAYYRTIIAIESPEGAEGLIGINKNGNSRFDWDQTQDGVQVTANFSEPVMIAGTRYVLATVTYTDVLTPGEVSRPSLLQVYMKSEATNEQVALFGDTFDILVYTQAVQATGFESAQEALETAFNGAITTDNHPWVEEFEEIDTLVDLQKALAKGGNYKLTADIAGNNNTLVVAGDADVTIDLNGKLMTNAVAGKAAIENYGNLTIKDDSVEKNGAIANGVNSTKASHTIINKGTLTIEAGNIGTDDTAGAAVLNYGTTTINGGNFASKQENKKSDGLCAYAFINQTGTMTINNATLEGQTHGLFGVYGGEIIVNGGTYTMDGNEGLGCYVVYSNGSGVVKLNGGTINTNSPRNDRVFFVYKNGNYFDENAVNTGCVVVNGANICLNGTQQTY